MNDEELLDSFLAKDPATPQPGDEQLLDNFLKESVAKQSRELLARDSAGEEVFADDSQRVTAVQAAKAGKGAWERAKEWTGHLIDPLVNPVTGAKMVAGFAKQTVGQINEAGKALAPILAPSKGNQFIEDGIIPDESTPEDISSRKQALSKLPAQIAAGVGRTGVGIVSLAGGAVSEGAELLGLSTPENEAGFYKFQHDANKAITDVTGVGKEDPVAGIAELAAFAGLPIGVESTAAPMIAKGAEAIVEGGTKIAGKTISGAARAGQVVGPAVAAAEALHTGHPIMALGSLLAGYTPAKYGWIGAIKHAIIDKGLGAVRTFGQAMSAAPRGTTLMKAAQNELRTEAGLLEARIADIRASNPDKLKRVDKIGPDGRPLYGVDDLSGVEKEIRLNEEKLKNARLGISQLDTYVTVNRVVSDAAKYALQSAGNLGVASTVGAAFTSAPAAPGDLEAQRQGQAMGLTFGLSGLHRANVGGRFHMLRDEMIVKGKKLIDGKQLEGLTPEQQNSIYAHAAEVSPLGGKIEILSPEEILKKTQKEGMPPEEGATAPNGIFEKSSNTLFINKNAIDSGVIGHEFGHLADQQLELAREKFSKDIQSRIDSGSEAYQKFADNYAERMRKSNPNFDRLSPEQINEEVKAEISRMIKLHVPPETFYGGKGGATIIKDWVSKLFNKDTGEIIGNVDAFGAPYTEGDLRALKDVFYEIGEKARSGEKFPASEKITGKTEATNNATKEPSGPDWPVSLEYKKIASDAEAALKALGIKDPGAKVQAAVNDIILDGDKVPTLEEVVKRATQRSVPKDLSDVSLMPASKGDTIDRPASKINDMIFPGTRPQAIKAAKKLGLEDLKIEDGFVTVGGKWMTPEEARLHGEERGQLPESIKDRLTPQDLTDERMFMPSPHPDAIDKPAIKRKSDGKVFVASRRDVPHWMMPQEHPELKDRFTLGGVDRYVDGWTTNKGEFLDKKEGHARAVEQKQIDRNFKTEYKGALSTLDLGKGGQFMPSTLTEVPESPGYVHDATMEQLNGHGAEIMTERAALMNYDGFKVKQDDGSYRYFKIDRDTVLQNNYMPATVNIGLDVKDGERLKPERVIRELNKYVDVEKHDVHQSGTEPTVVATLSRPLSPDEAHRVSEALHQEAIAQHDGARGELYGPKAEGWRPFNPDYFLNQDGKKLSEVPNRPNQAPEAPVTRPDRSGVSMEPVATKLDREPFKGKTIEMGEEPWSIRLKELAEKQWDKGLSDKEEEEYASLHKQAAREYGSYANWWEKSGAEKDYEAKVFGEHGQKNVQFMPSSDPRAIKEAAIKTKDGRIFTGLYHGEIMDRGLPRDFGNTFGWVDGGGNFLTRKEALARANEVGQDVRDADERTGLHTGDIPQEGINFMPAPHIEREAERLGLKYRGEMGPPDKAIHLYNDPITKSTIAIKHDAEPGKLQAKLRASRTKFGGLDQISMMPVAHEGFYSPLEKHLEDKMPNKVSPEQLSGILAKGGVKKAELEWTGINDLIDQAKKEGRQITKEEAVAFVRASTPEIKEIRKGAAERTPGEKRLREISQRMDELNSDPRPPYETQAEYNALDQEGINIRRSLKDSSTETKYHQYQLPGGENYRELLMTLPTRSESSPEMQRYRALSQEIESTRQELTRRVNGNDFSPESREISNNLKELESQRDALNPSQLSQELQGFKDPHFDEPNIVGHLRVNDRTLPDGKKMLFAEEVQSDWAQRGRKEGFDKDVNTTGWTAEKQPSGRYSVYDKDGEHAGYFNAKNPEDAIAAAAIKEKSRIGVPDMPFRGEAWKKLMLRNLIRHAVGGDHDSIGWTTGEQQADRYDLSKHLDNIELTREGDEFTIRGFPTQEAQIASLHESGIPVGKLADYIGKDLAEKAKTDLPSDGEKVYSGLDLKVGGEGMKGFYDKELVNLANDIGKKYGTKVEPSTLNVTGDKYEIQEYAGGHYVVDKNLEGGDLLTDHEYMSYDRKAAQKYADDLNAKDSGDINVHSMKITDAMRGDIRVNGQPMFMPSPPPSTPEFKRWFKESKVVDEIGRPKIVIHGTAQDFNRFDKNKLGSATNSEDTPIGFFFTEDPVGANFFAVGAARRRRGLGTEEAYHGFNPDDFGEGFVPPMGANVMPVLLSIQKPYEIGAREFSGEMFGWFSSKESNVEWVDSLKDAGYDGIKILGGARYMQGNPSGTGNAWVAFKPTQIKSATGNKGSWSTRSSDISMMPSPRDPSIDEANRYEMWQHDKEFPQYPEPPKSPHPIPGPSMWDTPATPEDKAALDAFDLRFKANDRPIARGGGRFDPVSPLGGPRTPEQEEANRKVLADLPPVKSLSEMLEEDRAERERKSGDPFVEARAYLGAGDSSDNLNIDSFVRIPMDSADSFMPSSPIGAARDQLESTGKILHDSDDMFWKKAWPALMKSTGKTLSKSKESNINLAAKQSVSDVRKFLDENPRFKDYYNKDWDETKKALDKHYGHELSDDELTFFKLAKGLTSPNTSLEINVADAMRVTGQWLKDGHLDSIKMGVSPKGNRVLAESPVSISGNTNAIKAFALKAIDKLSQDFGGPVKAANYLRESVPVSELEAFNKSLGYKGKVGKLSSIKELVKSATGQDEKIPRMFVFGRKVGAYTLNLLGDHKFNTVDVWESRFIRSQFKDMFGEGRTGLPVNVDEHGLFSRFSQIFNEEFNKQTGLNLDNSAMQAARWFYMIDSAKKAGYTATSTGETISEYVKKYIRKSSEKGRGLGDLEAPSGTQEEADPF